jgi:RNA polymerase sigma-70 factor (ECF subfamily)
MACRHHGKCFQKPAQASGEPSALETLEQKEISRKVQGCIEALDPEHKEVIVLRDMQDFSYEEISEVLGIMEGTVKSRLFRARDAVKNCLKKALGTAWQTVTA